MDHHFTAGQGALWVQVGGPNTAPRYLGCHQLGDVTEPEGDSTPFYCPDPVAPNRFQPVGSFQGAPGAITTSITTDITDVVDWLELIEPGDKFTIFVNQVKAGRMDVFTNRDRAVAFLNCSITSRAMTGLTARSPDDNARSEQSFDFSAEELFTLFDLILTRQGTALLLSISDVTYCNDRVARTADSPAMDACQIGFASTTGGGAAASKVYKTTNGSTWAVTAADPFAIADDLSAVECFEMGRNQTRVVVALGTTHADAPAKIAFSDDSGATWTVVAVGATNAEFFQGSGSLFGLNRNNLWASSNLGNIYYSEDGGVSWTVQENNIITNAAYNGVVFADESAGWAGGASGVIARSIDGGSTWAATVNPAGSADVTCIAAFDRNRAWIGTSDGKLYYTTDGGASWTNRTFIGSGTGAIAWIEWYNDLVGYMVRTTSGASVVLNTIDGGYSWQPMTTPTNAGINRAYACTLYDVTFVGEVHAATSFIAKASI